MTKKYLVYGFRAENDRELIYIGKTYMGSRRFQAHNYHTRRGTRSPLYNKLRKLNEAGIAVIVEPLVISLNENEANLIERKLIKAYGRKDLGFGPLLNLTDGGEGTVNISEAGRLARSKAHKGKIVTETTKEKIRQARATQDMTHSMRAVVAYDEDGNKVAHTKSIKGMAELLEIPQSSIRNQLNGRTKKNKKLKIHYIFKYFDEVVERLRESNENTD